MLMTCCDVLCLLQLLKDLRLKKLTPVTLKCDNQAALQIAANPVFHEWIRYMEVDCHFVRDQMKTRIIKTSYVTTAIGRCAD